MKFRNITKLPSGSWQLKFKKNRVEAQPVLRTIEAAIGARNKVYVLANYRPAHLFVNMFDMTVVADKIGIERSGSPYHRYQVNARRLIDRKYTPKGFSSKEAANNFAEQWIKHHNAIASVYNGLRETAFLEQIQRELDTLQPCIETQFDVKLWSKAAMSLFGSDIPEFFVFDIPDQ